MSDTASLDAAEQRMLEEARSRDATMRADLAAWVAIPTGRGHAAGVDRFRELLTGRLARLGASRRDVEGDPRPAWLPIDAAAADGPIPATSLLERAGEGVRFLIAGHLDTVHDPHGAFQRLEPIGGDRATGPGAADMKGGLLVATVALELLESIGEPVAWTFALNADEETGSFHSARALDEAARRHDVGLVFEPALPGGALAIERMGAGQFRIDCHGRAAHVGRDFPHGVSAVSALARCLVRIAELPDADRGTVANVGPISGGAATNIVPERAIAWGNVRFRDASGADHLGREIGALATERGAMPEVRVEYLANRPAKPCTPAVESLAREARRIAEAIGFELPFGSTGGVCDGNILQSAGLPTLDNLGVRGGNLHRLDEFVELDSLSERAALAAILIRRLRRRR
jgi:glutamate carboxypeptidase